MSKAALTILIALTLCAPTLLGLAGMPYSDDAPRLVIFPPWKNGVDLVLRSGGTPIGPREAPMGMLAYAADGAAFDQRVRRAGAWATIDGTALARLCGVPTTSVHEGGKA